MNNQNIKFVPMIFSTPMVQAILRGEKNQTRRIMNPQPKEGYTPEIYKGNDFKYHIESRKSPILLEDDSWHFANKGDIIWVRETFIEGYAMEDGNFMYDENGKEIPRTWYKADGDLGNWYNGTSDFPSENIPWKPSIHMPKQACRTWLKVTDVRVERLQDISEEDAIGEGIIPATKDKNTWKYGLEGWKWTDFEKTARGAYMKLWEQINGENSWDLNPWVFVYKFDRLEGMPEWFLPHKNTKD